MESHVVKDAAFRAVILSKIAEIYYLTFYKPNPNTQLIESQFMDLIFTSNKYKHFVNTRRGLARMIYKELL